MYPTHFYNSLTSTQFISLHLALQYTRHDRSQTLSASTRDRFWPFIESIPRADGFETVPLSWHVHRKSRAELQELYEVNLDDLSLRDQVVESSLARWHDSLLECLPASVRTRCDDVEKRFKSDWLKVKEVWTQHLGQDPNDGPSLIFLDFLLGWLNVNTRCVYFDMGRKASDNLTLAPMIDMINHADSRQTKPIQSMRRGLSFSSPPSGSSDPPLKAGDELAFSYGAHEDAMLIAEYGFTLHGSLGGNPFNNVDVTRIVEQLFNDAGQDGQLKKGVLQDSGYWGEMTFQRGHSSDDDDDDASQAHASWRVLIALRLLHLRLPSAGTGPLANALEPWYAVLAGDADTIASSNESLVHQSIRTIASVVVLQTKESLAKIQALERRWKIERVPDSLRASLGMLKGICEDEQKIVEQLLGSTTEEAR